MIKRFLFGPPGDLLDPGRADRAVVPAAVRPVRSVVCSALTDILPEPRYGAVTIDWFVDRRHLDGHDRWQKENGHPAPPSATVLVADELVLRGADWLEQRWRRGGARLKHMAVARRAAGLTTQEFSDRWKGRAGTLRRDDGRPLVIPDEARGLAYVQDHPLASGGQEPPFDAVNEVWFDDQASLMRRIDWFAKNVPGADDDLVSQSWFLAVREEPVSDPTPFSAHL